MKLSALKLNKQKPAQRGFASTMLDVALAATREFWINDEFEEWERNLSGLLHSWLVKKHVVGWQRQLGDLLLDGMCFFAALKSPQDAVEGWKERHYMDEDVAKISILLEKHYAVNSSPHVPTSATSSTSNPSTLSKSGVQTILKIMNVSDVPTRSEVVLYYAGHGAATGNWCIEGGEVSLRDVLEQWALRDVLEQWAAQNQAKSNNLLIIADCCYSNKWVDDLKGLTEYHKLPICIQGTSDSDSQGDVLARFLGSSSTAEEKIIPQTMRLDYWTTPSFQNRVFPLFDQAGQAGEVFFLPVRKGTPEDHRTIDGLQKAGKAPSCKDNTFVACRGPAPLGFNSYECWSVFVIQTLRKLPADTQMFFHGSAINGFCWMKKRIVRTFNEQSDYDILLVSNELHQEAEILGVKQNSPLNSPQTSRREFEARKAAFILKCLMQLCWKRMNLRLSTIPSLS